MPPKVKAPKVADVAVAEEMGMEFGTPPEITRTRKSKHDERWTKARALTEANKGQNLKVLTYNQPSQPYSMAKAINNGDHAYFKDNDGMVKFKAVGAANGDGTFSIWLTYIGE